MLTTDFQIPSLLFHLIITISLLLSLTVIYSYSLPFFVHKRPLLRSLINGVVFGVFGVIDMGLSIVIAPGLLFDGRNLMIAVAGAFAGPRASLVAAVIIIVARFMIGGAGVPSAVASALSSVAISYWFSGRARQTTPAFNARQLLVLGLLIALQQAFWATLITPEAMQATLFALVLASLILLPLTTLLIGRLLLDQTARFELDAELKETNDIFQQLIHQLRQVVWVTDREQRLLYVSPSYEALTQQSGEALHRDLRDFLTLVHPDDRKRVAAGLFQHPEGGVDEEFRYMLKDGTVRWVAARTFPIVDDRGNIQKIVGLAEDITERKAAATEKLELETERARVAGLREFIANASHDLGTPLTVMQTSLYLLARAATDDRQRQYIDRLKQQVDRIQTMITNLLTLARLEAGSAGRELMATDVNSVVGMAVAVIQIRAERKHQQVRVHPDPTTPHVWADPAELELAIEHLLDNAVIFSPDAATIEVRVSHDEDTVAIEIQDEGMGIPEALHDRIFEPFYRIDQARGADTGGSGLGLTIAQKIVQTAGGRITVTSSEGSGSVFRIELRRCKGDAAAAHDRN
ncbi:MAG: ATP-binding protein [Chloroflexota bacterium]|nr:MAG: hypothetical protein DIU68_18745 [Chloroflexota bacterium]